MGTNKVIELGRRVYLSALCGLACQDRKSGGAQISASGCAASRRRITDMIFINKIK